MHIVMAVRLLEEGDKRHVHVASLRVRRRAPGIYLRRVIAETKRAAIREMPVEWLINTLGFS